MKYAHYVRRRSGQGGGALGCKLLEAALCVRGASSSLDTVISHVLIEQLMHHAINYIHSKPWVDFSPNDKFIEHNRTEKN
jgi:hypothetical protein